MNKDWEKIDQLFHQALECPNEEREEFLASAAQRDPALGSKLQALLDAHENNHSFMNRPPCASTFRLNSEVGSLRSQRTCAIIRAPDDRARARREIPPGRVVRPGRDGRRVSRDARRDWAPGGR